MQQLKHFQDVISFCLDYKDQLTRRDIIASLSYIGTCKGKDFKSERFKLYINFILDKVDVLFTNQNIYLLVHRLAVLNYTPGLSMLYKKHISRIEFDHMDTKCIAIITWGFIKTDLSYTQLFESISQSLLQKIHCCNLTDVSLLLWSYCRFIPLQYRLISLLEIRLFEILNAIEHRLMGFLNNNIKFVSGSFITSNDESAKDQDKIIDYSSIADKKNDISGLADQYIDTSGKFYTNISHDLSMCAKSLALIPGHANNVQKLVDFTLLLSEAGKVDLTAQCLTSLWEALAEKDILDDKLLDRLCESSRYLRLDHTFNSNMLSKIMQSNIKLRVKDPRIIYQCIHWLEKRAEQMHANHIYIIAKCLVALGVDNEKAWKRLGVAIQSRGIELAAAELEELINFFKKIGRGNERIYGVLNHFIAVKNDHAMYGPS